MSKFGYTSNRYLLVCALRQEAPDTPLFATLIDAEPKDRFRQPLVAEPLMSLRLSERAKRLNTSNNGHRLRELKIDATSVRLAIFLGINSRGASGEENRKPRKMVAGGNGFFSPRWRGLRKIKSLI
jgi:hypothetical protein